MSAIRTFSLRDDSVARFCDNVLRLEYSRSSQFMKAGVSI